MKINLKDFLSKVKLTTIKKSSWNEDGYKNIQFKKELEMTHKKFGDFAWIGQEEIEIEIPDKLFNKPVETTNEQPKIMCYKHDASNNKLHCSTCKNYCTVTGNKILDLLTRR